MKNKKYLKDLGNFRLRLFFNWDNPQQHNKNKQEYKKYQLFRQLPQKYKNVLSDKLNRPRYLSIINDSEKLGIYEIHITERKTPNGSINTSKIFQYLIYDKVKNSVRYSSKEAPESLIKHIIASKILVNTPYEWLTQAYTTFTREVNNGVFRIMDNKEPTSAEIFSDIRMLYDILKNKTILKSIFIGTITSTKELKKRYMTQLGLKNIGFDSMYKSLVAYKKNEVTIFGDKKSSAFINDFGGIFPISENYFSTLRGYSFNNKIMLQSYIYASYVLKSSSNPERDYKKLIHFLTFKHATDLINECVILNEKINLSWSHKRLSELHTVFSKRITEVKALFEEKVTLTYTDNPFNTINNSFKLLTNSTEFLYEGTEMHHCLYSNNYFSKATRKECFILKYSGNDRGTAEVRIDGIVSFTHMLEALKTNTNYYFAPIPEDGVSEDEINYVKYSIAQFRGLRNKSLSEEATAELRNLLAHNDVKTWVATTCSNPLKTTTYSERTWEDVIKQASRSSNELCLNF